MSSRSDSHRARAASRERFLRRLAWALLSAFAVAAFFAVYLVGENGRLREDVAGAKSRALFSDSARMFHTARAAKLDACEESAEAILADYAEHVDRLARCEGAAAFWADRAVEAATCDGDLVACRAWLGRCDGGFSSDDASP